MTQKERILKNIEDLSSKIESASSSIISTENQNIHKKIILQNLNIISNSIKTSPDEHNFDSTSSEIMNWHDSAYWINHIGWSCEILCFYTKNQKKLSKLLRDLANHVLGFSFLTCRFLDYTNFPSLEKSTLKDLLTDPVLLEFQIENSESLFLYFLRKIECFVSDYYSQNLSDRLPKNINKLNESLKLICKNHPKDNELQKFKEEFDKETTSLTNFEWKIRETTKELLPQEDRRKQIQVWLFFLHLRNAIMHKDRNPTVDHKIELGERSFKLQKSKSFRDHDFRADSYLTFSLHLLLLFMNLFGKIDKELWLSIQKDYFTQQSDG